MIAWMMRKRVVRFADADADADAVDVAVAVAAVAVALVELASDPEAALAIVENCLGLQCFVAVAAGIDGKNFRPDRHIHRIPYYCRSLYCFPDCRSRCSCSSSFNKMRTEYSDG